VAYNQQLRDLIIQGRAEPSRLVSHELGLEEAVDAYDSFDKRLDGWTKVLLRPASWVPSRGVVAPWMRSPSGKRLPDPT
jgi:hypothetical protein